MLDDPELREISLATLRADSRLGNLLLLPQPPRAGRPGEAYHDLSLIHI
nr:hypothetical protein [Pseudomonas aeruginosa]